MPLTQTELDVLFSSLSNWQDRYRQIIQLSKESLPFSEMNRNDKNQIEGCENKVWLTYKYNVSEQTLTFYGDSESRIVKGLLVIILMLSSGKTVTEIAQFDILSTLKQLNIIEQLSESRQLGIRNIIERIHQIASQLMQQGD